MPKVVGLKHARASAPQERQQPEDEAQKQVRPIPKFAIVAHYHKRSTRTALMMVMHSAVFLMVPIGFSGS